MPHALARLQQASEALLTQQLSVLEWTAQWRCCAQDLENLPLPEPLRQQSRVCLRRIADFAENASLSELDRGLAELRNLRTQWDHWWWIGQRQGQPWPEPTLPASLFQVTRQNGRSRVSWNCPRCDWSLSWDLPVAAYDSVEWPGPMECPLGCSTASNDAPRACENLPSECGG